MSNVCDICERNDRYDGVKTEYIGYETRNFMPKTLRIDHICHECLADSLMLKILKSSGNLKEKKKGFLNWK